MTSRPLVHGDVVPHQGIAGLVVDFHSRNVGIWRHLVLSLKFLLCPAEVQVPLWVLRIQGAAGSGLIMYLLQQGKRQPCSGRLSA
jgi:hypothetical protein